MKLLVDNRYTWVAESTGEEWKWLYEDLVFEDEKNSFYFDKLTGQARRKPGGPEKERLLDVIKRCFPAGLTRDVITKAQQQGFEVLVADTRAPPCEVDWDADVEWLYDYQREAVDTMCRRTRGIIKAGTGCHARGQGILLHSGKIKPVEDITVGDRLMGPDNLPRAVTRLHRGRQTMARVIPVKGDPWDVNLDHVLTLVRTNCGTRRAGEVIDVPVREWLQWSPKKKHLYKLMRAGADFPQKALPVDPYFVGVLLGDGCLSQGVRICNPEPEVRRLVYEQADAWGLEVRCGVSGGGCPVWGLVAPGKGVSNPLVDALRELRIMGCTAANKRVPEAYKINSRRLRLECLAGLLDTDGHLSRNGYDFISKSKGLSEDVAFLARSLGLAAYIRECTKSCQNDFSGTYWRVSVSGHVDVIPCRVPRKIAKPRKQKKDVLRTGFSVEILKEDDFYGFTTDQDGRYLLDDFTVTHNSGKGDMLCALIRRIPCRWGILVGEQGLMTNMAERWERIGGEPCGRVGDGQWDVQDHRVVACTFQTLAKRLEKQDPEAEALLRSFDAIAVDEVHQTGARTFFQVTQACDAYWRVGLSATPLDRTDRMSVYTVAAIGPIAYEVDTQMLIDRGFIARPHIVMHRHAEDCEAKTHNGAYSKLVVKSTRRNKLLVEIARGAEKPALLFVKQKNHGQELVKRLNKEGIQTTFVWGALSTEQRKEVIRQLRWGELDVAVCSVVFQTGIDIPEVAAVINGAGGKSAIATLQRIGRGMRVVRDKDGNPIKTEMEVHDIMDTENKWLRKHAVARKKTYEREGHTVHLMGETGE